MNQKQIIAMWCGIIAVVFFSILGRVLFPVYRDVFHGIIVLMFLVALLIGGSILPPEAKKTSGQKMAGRTKRKDRGLATIESSHKRPRKRSAARRLRKRKRLPNR